MKFKIALLVMVAFIGGMAVQSVFSPSEPAESALLDSYNNQVFEMSSAVTVDNPVYIYEQPDLTATQVDRLLWGDRVLWRGTEQQDGAGNRWIYVSLSEGVSGWMIGNPADVTSGRIAISSPTYTTPGIALGAEVVVTADGDGANFREGPSVGAERIRPLIAGEELTVIGGPYQNELFVWWRFSDADGGEGWVVDIDGWMAAQ